MFVQKSVVFRQQKLSITSLLRASAFPTDSKISRNERKARLLSSFFIYKTLTSMYLSFSNKNFNDAIQNHNSVLSDVIMFRSNINFFKQIYIRSIMRNFFALINFLNKYRKISWVFSCARRMKQQDHIFLEFFSARMI